MNSHEKIDLDSVAKESKVEIKEDRFNKEETVNTSKETAKNLSKEAIDSDAFESQNKGKSLSELQEDIIYYREQIKLGEQRGANGGYNEAKVLENEAKLRATEKLIMGIKEKNKKDSPQEAKKPDTFEPKKEAKTIEDFKSDIAYYREQIRRGEQKGKNGDYNEAKVLENESKLREAEKEMETMIKIKEIQKEIEEYKNNVKTGEKKGAYGGYNEKMILENEAKIREKEKELMNIYSETPEPQVKKKKQSFWKRIFENKAK